MGLVGFQLGTDGRVMDEMTPGEEKQSSGLNWATGDEDGEGGKGGVEKGEKERGGVGKGENGGWGEEEEEVYSKEPEKWLQRGRLWKGPLVPVTMRPPTWPEGMWWVRSRRGVLRGRREEGATGKARWAARAWRPILEVLGPGWRTPLTQARKSGK